jgi:hypothetical protein
VLLPVGAVADYTATQGTGSTIFAFVCFTTKICPAHVLTNSAGTEIATSGNPVRTDPTGTTTQPVSAASLPLPTGAATSANQTTNGATTAHTCATTGFSELGCLGQIDDDIKGPVPAGTNTIGNVGSDPSSGKGTPSSKAINVSTATTTQLVAISGTTKIYVTSFDVIAGGTGNITFEYGTQTTNPCDTGTTALTGPYNLTAQAGISKGDGVGAVLVVPAGNALCVLTSAAVQMSGSVSYQQF